MMHNYLERRELAWRTAGVHNDTVEAGEMLILTVAKKFDASESGHLLFKFLYDRASCGSAKDGLVNADELRRKIDDWHGA